MAVGDLARLIEEAVAASRVVTPETVETVWEPLRQAAEAGPDAVEAGLQMLLDPDRDVRGVGCDLLAECCKGDGAPTRRIAEALVALAALEDDGEVQWSIASSLGFTEEPIAVPVLAALASHEDEDIRYQVARSLPEVARGRRDDAVVDALILLTGDHDPEVRNWATFGLGRQLEDDSTRIRDALWARISDEAHDVREEAACGLARRRDRRALPLIQELLREDDPHVWVFDAAEALADASLLPLLEPYGREGLERVFAACDPQQSAARQKATEQFLDLLQETLDRNGLGRAASIHSDRLDNGLALTISPDRDRAWSASALLDDASNDPVPAVARVVAELFSPRDVPDCS